MLLTIKDCPEPFTTLGMLGKNDDGTIVYSLIANQPITDDLVQKMFTTNIHDEDMIWDYAYPESKATDNFQLFQLDNNIFYINTMESAASTIEASIIGARNVINLLRTGNE